MVPETLANLLEQNESNWLEFKSFWYWNNKDEDLSKPWGEFLKDFAGLFNSITPENRFRYFIFGFDERTKETHNFYVDKNATNLDMFESIDSFKAQLIDKIRRHFCQFDGERSIEINTRELDGLFKLETIEVQEKTLLILTIFQTHFLLIAKKQICGNESYRENCIIVRRLKKDRTPENAILNPVDIPKYIEATSTKSSRKPYKVNTIKKIVESYKENISPNCNIDESNSQYDHQTGIIYDCFIISGKHINSFSFIHLKTNTSKEKTINYIIENKVIETSETTYVLTDERNKNGTLVDTKRLTSLLTERGVKCKVYKVIEFSQKELYQEFFTSEIFHDGKFNISDFVKPTCQWNSCSIKSTKTADLLLNEWYETEHEPLLLIKGIGGVGKTTLVKFFFDSVYIRSIREKKNTNILFINSQEIINDIMKSPKIEDLYDFYNILANKHDVRNKFNRNLLELSTDSGDLIIALDGIDEVIIKMGDRFNIKSFVDSIFSNYSENIGKTKIIITCRDYFWNDDILNPNTGIHTISLEPFNAKLAEEYFNKSFPTLPNKSKKAFELAKEFAFKNKNEKVEDIYIPYILDIIKEHLVDKEANADLESEILDVEYQIDDKLVAKVCQREIIKLGNLKIDDQVNILIFLALEHGGIAKKKDIEIYAKNKITHNFDFNALQKFNGHPLLVYNKADETLTFKYDFFNEYFKVLALANFLINYTYEKKIAGKIEDSLCNYIGADSNFTEEIIKRFRRKGNYERLKENISLLLMETNEQLEEAYSRQLELSDEEKISERLQSALFALILYLSPQKDRKNNTELLIDIYKREDGCIFNLNLIDTHSLGNQKLIFDFSGLKFKYCTFANYEYFTSCTFDNKSYFSSCKFRSPLSKKQLSCNLTLDNFKASSCEMGGIIDLIDNNQKTTSKNSTELRNNLKRIFRFFWVGSSFKKRKVNVVTGKLNSLNKLVLKLKDLKVLEVRQITTSEKRKDPHYVISDNYRELRKIMEENDSCAQFEKLVKTLSKVN